MALSRASLAASMLIACSALGGCVADAGEPDEVSADAVDETVEEAGLAFGEATCATVTPTYTHHTVWPPSYTGPSVAMTGGTYGSEDCTHALVVDYANGTTYDSRIDVSPYNAPTNQVMCAATHVRAKTYEQVNGTWVPFEETSLHGVWAWGACLYPPDPGYDALHLSENPTRVTAQAYQDFCLFGSCSPMYVGVKIRARTIE